MHELLLFAAKHDQHELWADGHESDAEPTFYVLVCMTCFGQFEDAGFGEEAFPEYTFAIGAAS